MRKYIELSKPYIYYFSEKKNGFYLVNLKNLKKCRIGMDIVDVLSRCHSLREESEMAFWNQRYHKFLEGMIGKGILKIRTENDNEHQYFKFYINSTRMCNLKCSFCLVDSNVQDVLTTEKIIEILEEFPKEEKKQAEICISGGEPMLLDNLRALIAYCNNNFRTTSVLTNGTLISEENYRIFEGVHAVGISIDSADGVKHDAIRGVNDSYKRALEAIKCVRTLTNVTIQSTVSHRNVEKMVELTKLAADLDVCGIRFSVLHNVGHAEGIELFDSDDYLRYLELMVELRKEYPFLRINSSLNESNLGDVVGCGANRSILIDSAGFISICPGFADDKNFRVAIREGWRNEVNNNNRFWKIYREPLNNGKNCFRCGFRTFCQGGCFAEKDACVELKKGMVRWLDKVIWN